MPCAPLILTLLLACGDPPFGSTEPPPDDTLPGASAEPISHSRIDLSAAAALFRQARALSDADGGALWRHELYGPMLFVDAATRATVANVPPQRVPRGEAFTKHEIDGQTIYSGTLPGDVSLGNTATTWAGRRWSMVLWPIQAETIWSGTLMMHESFHRLQPDLRIPLAVPANHHLDAALGRLWLRMEWRALAAALEQEDPLASDALADALAFRRYRQSLFDDALGQERALELNEGLAEYTGLRLGGADAEAQLRYALHGLRAYDGLGPLVRRFAYASGPPYGLLLDRARPDWRRDVDEHSDMARMLERAVRYRAPKELDAHALERAALYDYDTALEQETARETQRQERLQTYRDRYVDNPVLIVEMGGAYNYAFSPYDVHAFDDVGTVYGTMQLNGPFGSLDASGGALVIENDRGHRRVILPAPTDADARPLIGEGWSIQLDAGWTLGPGPRPSDLVLVAPRDRRRRP